ncbi:MAG: hypothetical protein KKE23_01500 [Nanoarchaeota archaeon]|nr:hypothetical protein [Nanoarchaeota archaeon]
MGKITEALEYIMEIEGQDRVFTDLKDNCMLDKSSRADYNIDLENILNSAHFVPLKESKNLNELYSTVRMVLGNPRDCEQGNDKNFSEILKSGQGDCMEKSALFQIAMDFFRKTGNHPLSGKRSFYVSAFLKTEFESDFSRHAFNIVTSEKENLLIDLENPLLDGENNEIPYIVSASIKQDSCEIVIPKKFAFGRIYHL